MGVDLVPTIDDFRPVVLRVLVDGKARALGEVCELASTQAGLSQEARDQRLPSGELRYVNRIGWACSALTHAGLVTRPKRGWYEITADGRQVDQRNLTTYSEKDMLEWPMWRAYQQEVADRKTEPDAVTSDLIDAGAGDPVERLETGVSEFNAKVETELRRALQDASPEFFEKAVIELLWAMGYGGTHGDKQHVGRTGDGGIDGVINQDALGLQRVLIQAKRYGDGNNVGSSAIRDFYGALHERGAERGVFITSSKFTGDARHTAEKYNGQIVLIDGIRLTSLMLDYGVAVQKIKEFPLFAVDEDFFESALS